MKHPFTTQRLEWLRGTTWLGHHGNVVFVPVDVSLWNADREQTQTCCAVHPSTVMPSTEGVYKGKKWREHDTSDETWWFWWSICTGGPSNAPPVGLVWQSTAMQRIYTDSSDKYVLSELLKLKLSPSKWQTHLCHDFHLFFLRVPWDDEHPSVSFISLSGAPSLLQPFLCLRVFLTSSVGFLPKSFLGKAC